MTWLKTAHSWTDSWLEQWQQKPAWASLVECSQACVRCGSNWELQDTHTHTHILKNRLRLLERWTGHGLPTSHPHISHRNYKKSGRSKSLTVDPAVNSPFDDPIDMATGPCVGPIWFWLEVVSGCACPWHTSTGQFDHPSWKVAFFANKALVQWNKRIQKGSDFRVLVERNSKIAVDCNMTTCSLVHLAPTEGRTVHFRSLFQPCDAWTQLI